MFICILIISINSGMHSLVMFLYLVITVIILCIRNVWRSVGRRQKLLNVFQFLFGNDWNDTLMIKEQNKMS